MLSISHSKPVVLATVLTTGGLLAQAVAPQPNQRGSAPTTGIENSGGAALAPLPQVGRSERVSIEIRGVANPFRVQAPVAERIIHQGPASYIQLNFDQVKLPGGSAIEIHAFGDRDTQVLTGADLEGGKLHSAYFNGPAVRVRLLGAPGAAAPSARIYEIDRGMVELTAPESICGSADNRRFSSRKPICRLLISKSGGTYVCTGWLVSTSRGGHVTAGHCLSGANRVTAQYNVPRSTSSGAIRNPSASHQYTWRSATRRFSNRGVGNDWGVFRVQGNPYTKQGKYFSLRNATRRNYVRNGYGSASGTRNFAQKQHSGSATSVSSTTVRYRIDSTGGDSGGPVFYVTGGKFYAGAIHSHGGCTATGGANAATNVRRSDFRSAYATVR